jgi:tyrosinase
MSQQEKTDLIKVLKEAKTEGSSKYTWAVVVQEPNQNGLGLRLENISTYDLFVYHHYFSKREGPGDVNNIVGSSSTPACKTSALDLSAVDFAHKGPSFLTWHRYYLLLVERELGRVAERLGGTSWNRYTFALPYWDWDDSEAAIADIFSKDHFGTFTKDADRDSVRGVLFNDKGWPTVCDLHYWLNVNYAGSNYNIQLSCGVVRRLCNPNDFRDDRYPLQRGSFRRRGQKLNETDIRALPDRNTIKYLINTAQYDAPCDQAYINRDGYDSTASEDSFRNRVEGFVNLQNPATGQFKNCKKRTYQDHNNFHNAVHIYIHGHMRIVPSASNDPIFYLHHANIDRFFEEWLQGMGANANYMPTSRIAHPGHNTEDYLVPFFPLKTNVDMFKKSSDFGYSYEEQNLAQGAGFSVLYPSSFAGIIARIALPIVAVVVMNGHQIIGGLQ